MVSDDLGSVIVSDEGNLDKLEFWVEIKEQVKILREGMEDENT